MIGAAIRRWRWALLVAGMLVVALAFSFWPEAVDIDEAQVTRGPMRVGVSDDGVVRVRDLYTVSAPITGHVTRIALEAGDTVVANRTVIARMAAAPSAPLDVRTRAELRGALQAARAAEQGAAAALDLARSDLSRAEQLAQRGFLARSRLEAARAAALTREADLDRSRAESRRLQASLSEPTATGGASGADVAVRSPESGVVLRRLVASEGVVAIGTPLVEIGDPVRTEVVIDLLSREAVRVKPGAPADITRWGGERSLSGTVRRVEPFAILKTSALGIEEQRANVIIDLDPRAAARAALGHGYQVDATIWLWSSPDALRVPVGALFRGRDGGWHVFVIADGRARDRSVRIGHINEQFGEVLAGLGQGDRVVLNPGNRVENGVRVRRR